MSKKKQPYTHISFVIDRSGSMGGLEEDTVGGFNSFIEKQKEAPGKATVSRYQFDHDFQTDYSFEDITTLKEFTRKEYVPRGSTALNDGIGLAVSHTQARLDKLKASRRRLPDKVYLVVTTDGGENASVEFKDVNKLKTLLEQKQAQKDVIWEIIFLGANLNVQAVANNFSIPLGKVASYTSNKVGTNAVYANVATAMLRSRVSDAFVCEGELPATASFEFNAEERASIENTK